MKFFCLFIFLLATTVHANLYLDVDLINKKGIDKGLVLVNELHTTEEVFGIRPVAIEMKDHMRLELVAKFVSDYGTYGPSALIMVTAKMISPSGNVLKDFSDKPLLVPLNTSKMFVFEKEDLGQSIEVTIKPHLK